MRKRITPNTENLRNDQLFDKVQRDDLLSRLSISGGTDRPGLIDLKRPYSDT